MRVSLVRVKRREGGEGEVSRRETIVEGETLRVGRGLDCDITIADVEVDHHHATLFLQDGKLLLKTVSETSPAKDRLLEPGRPVEIGGHTMTLEPAPAHADFAIALEATERKADPKAVLPQRLAEALPSRRRLAWLLAVPALALFFIWPLTQILMSPIPEAEAVEVIPTTGDMVEASPAMVASWTSGPMSRAHELIGDDCSSCHLRPFEMTTNNACLACHADTGRHADLAPHPVAGLDDARCGACHKEHNGGIKPIEQASALCVDCHGAPGELLALAPETDLREVHDFGADHPQFRITGGQPYLPDWVQGGGSEGLKFPHDVHLTGAVSAPAPLSAATLREGPLPDGWTRETVETRPDDPDGGKRVRSPEGRLFTLAGRADLGCADCHVSEAGGGLMRPVEMERDCAWCHQLKIDTLDVARDVPHANETEVVAIIRDYYRARALEGGVSAKDAPPFAQRRRGAGFQSASADDLSDASVQDAVAWARDKADAHLERVFNDEGVDPATGAPTYDVGAGLCAYCHRAERQDGEEDRPWRIVPARLARHWMPMAQFQHGPHEAMDCVACHEATTSKASADVLMPKIEGCRDCHMGEDVAGAASECLACHIFHNEDYGPISPAHAALRTGQMWNAERAEPREAAQ
jgi:hypothetical protein